MWEEIWPNVMKSLNIFGPAVLFLEMGPEEMAIYAYAKV